MSTQRQHTIRTESNSKNLFHCLSFVRYARYLHAKCARCVLSLYVIHWECQVYSLIYSAAVSGSISFFLSVAQTISHLYERKWAKKCMANNNSNQQQQQKKTDNFFFKRKFRPRSTDDNRM